jgi:hypothetical protein
MAAPWVSTVARTCSARASIRDFAPIRCMSSVSVGGRPVFAASLHSSRVPPGGGSGRGWSPATET